MRKAKHVKQQSKTTSLQRTAFALMSLLLSLSLMSCAPMTSLSAPRPPITKPTNEFCAIYKPIHWSKSDTDQTLIEVKENNAVWVKLCKPA